MKDMLSYPHAEHGARRTGEPKPKPKPMTKPMTRTLDLLRNRPWNMQAVITESGNPGFVYFYVRIEPIDGPLHVTEKTTVCA